MKRLIMNVEYWDTVKLREDNNIENLRVMNGFIYCVEKKTGTEYKTSQIAGFEELEPTWSKTKSWEVNEINREDELYMQSQDIQYDFDEVNYWEVEECNRSFVNDDVYRGYESTDDWREICL